MTAHLPGIEVKESSTKYETMKRGFFLLGIISLMFIGTVQAQTGWNWPDNKPVAEEKNALYTDSFRQGNFRRAANHLYWLLVNAPDLNESIYINGIKIYNGLASEATDEAQRIIYQDSVLTLYDLRIKHFNDEGTILNRKAFDAYKFYKDDRSRYDELYNLFKTTFELNGNKVMDVNLLSYMDVVRRYKLSGGNITDEEVLNVYSEVLEIINFKIANKGKNVDRLERIKDQINQLLVATVDVDCEFIEKNLGPKLKEEPDNLKLAKNILRLSFAGKCMEKDVALDAAKVVQKHEPEYGLAKLIAQLSYAKKDFDTSVKYFEESVELTDDNTKKSDSYIELAKINVIMDKKVSARDYCRKAIQVDATAKEAYKIIGDLYYNSFNDCKKGENPVHDRAVYIAAYEMYQKAGDAAAMRRAKEQFPSMEEIFTWNMEVGETYRIGCWINETIAIDKR
jgi:tetratricopeptide (TPR) repeat protein